jgi:hypothetical protein
VDLVAVPVQEIIVIVGGAVVLVAATQVVAELVEQIQLLKEQAVQDLIIAEPIQLMNQVKTLDMV